MTAMTKLKMVGAVSLRAEVAARRWPDRAGMIRASIWPAVCLVALAGTFLALVGTGAALAYDGSYHFRAFIEHGASLAGTLSSSGGSSPIESAVRLLDFRSWPVPQQRLSDIPVIAATMVVSQATGSIEVTAAVYNALWVLPPFLALAISWFFSRPRPVMFVWGALGIGLATVPGDFFFLSEQLAVVNLSWPLLLGTLCLQKRWRLIGTLTLAGVMFYLHPSSAALFVVCAMAAMGLALFGREDLWSLLVLAALLLVLAYLRLTIPLMPYESETLNVATLRNAFKVAVEGPPLFAIGCGLVIAVALTLEGLPSTAARQGVRLVCRIAVLVAIGGAAVALSQWALTPKLWRYALEYRSWVLIINTPFAGLAIVDRLWGLGSTEPGAPAPSKRRRHVYALLLVFSLVLTLQSISWHKVSANLAQAVQTSEKVCLTRADIPWLGETPFYHWSTPTYVVLLQGRAPLKLLLEAGDCTDASFGTRVRLNPWSYSDRAGGWFDLTRAGLPSR